MKRPGNWGKGRKGRVLLNLTLFGAILALPKKYWRAKQGGFAERNPFGGKNGDTFNGGNFYKISPKKGFGEKGLTLWLAFWEVYLPVLTSIGITRKQEDFSH